MPATTSTRATLGDAVSQDQNFDSGKGLPWGTRTRSCGISSGWHFCRQALWCRLLFWNTGMGYAAVASGNWSFQSSLQQGYAILAACPNRTMQFPSASPSSNVDIPMNYLSLTHLWRIPGLLLLLCARHLQLRQRFAWCAIFTLLCFLLHLLRRRVEGPIGDSRCFPAWNKGAHLGQYCAKKASDAHPWALHMKTLACHFGQYSCQFHSTWKFSLTETRLQLSTVVAILLPLTQATSKRDWLSSDAESASSKKFLKSFAFALLLGEAVSGHMHVINPPYLSF